MRPFDSKQEAYDAGFNDGVLEQKEVSRHEMDELMVRIRRLQKDGECGCEQYSECWDRNHNPPGTVLSKED